MATKQRPPKPFPHLCPECGATAVYPEQTNHKTSFKYEGHLHEFEAPNITLNKCRECGGIILPNTALEQIADAFRVHAKLLTAEKIRGELQRLKLSQKEFGDLLGVAPETVSRWLTSVQIQTRSLDRLMRLFFKSSEVRRDLADMKDGVSPAPVMAASEPSSPGPVGSRPAPRFAGRFSTSVQTRQDRFQLIASLN